jgi:hypothetical protein
VNIRQVVKYFCLAVVIAAVLEIALLLLGYWLKVRIPVVVTIGLLLGVIAWLANKLHRSNS